MPNSPYDKALVTVIGVDPGATTGVFAYTPGTTEKPVAVQIIDKDPNGATAFVRKLMDQAVERNRRHLVSVEAFVIGGRATRSSNPAAGRLARSIIAALEDMSPNYVSRPAVAVKAWATDDRLRAAGMFEATRALPHARDAARHALFAAVRSGLAQDPFIEHRRRVLESE